MGLETSFKMHYRVIEPRRHQKSHTDQWNRIGNPGINLHSYSFKQRLNSSLKILLKNENITMLTWNNVRCYTVKLLYKLHICIWPVFNVQYLMYFFKCGLWPPEFESPWIGSLGRICFKRWTKSENLQSILKFGSLLQIPDWQNTWAVDQIPIS